MNNREKAYFTLCARGACIIVGLEALNTEAVQLAATIKRNFEGLGV